MIRLLHGDCRDVLKTLPSASVQCCVTSPPYYGLRDYQSDEQIGLEPTSDGYIAELLKVFQEIRRILKSDGIVWLNLGDSYANKQRMMIPARVSLALQADGWFLRDEIVWHKPRTTPFPAIDRTVAAHEMIYLLTKSNRYYFDYLAIEEPADYAGEVRSAGSAFRDLAKSDPNAARKRPSADRKIVVRETRRKRSVWSISPSPYKDGHFATMPPDVAEICILAGSRTGDTIIDPFFGAGTTGLVADRLGRDCVGIEINSDHIGITERRIVKDAGMFAEIAS